MSTNRPQRRTDMLASTKEPHPPVQSLGSSKLHGPSRDEHIVLVLGVGPGLGLAIARVFAQQGYTTAILSRNKQRLDAWAKEVSEVQRRVEASKSIAEASTVEQLDETIKQVRKDDDNDAPQSLAFACDVLHDDSIKRAIDDIQKAWPDKKIGTAVYNASVRKRGPFLDQRSDQIRDGVQTSIFAGVTFMQSVLAAMVAHNGNAGGNILVTGATSSTRGREGFAGFAASKSGLRAVCQSVAREFGPRNIHVAHIIVDGLIESQEAIEFFGLEKESRFPDGAALRPEEMCKAWLFLASQHKSAWTLEMDLRPAKEHF